MSSGNKNWNREKKSLIIHINNIIIWYTLKEILYRIKIFRQWCVYMDKVKILLVDDESRMRKLVKDFLVKKDYMVIEAEDGAKAIDLFFSNKDISLVILDVMMPNMDGWQVCREIRNFSKVPIIMLTAKADERSDLQGFDLGVDEYITKPFSPKILVARVDAILRRAHLLVNETVLSVGGIEINKSAHVVTID